MMVRLGRIFAAIDSSRLYGVPDTSTQIPRVVAIHLFTFHPPSGSNAAKDEPEDSARAAVKVIVIWVHLRRLR